MKLKIFLIIFLLVSMSQAIANPWCDDRSPTADIKQIDCISSFDACPKSINIPQAVRKSFNEIIQKQKTCPKCESTITNEKKYLPLYQLPFLVTAVTTPKGGSYSSFFVHIIFKEQPKQEFELGMSCADEGGYELNSIVPNDPSKKMERLIKKLSRKEYSKYWVKF